MKNRLVGKQLWFTIEPTEEEMIEAAEEAKKDDKAARKERMKCAIEARCILFSSLSNSLIPLFENEKDFPFNDAKKLWCGIVKHFESGTTAARNNLKEQLFSVRMKQGEKMDSYISRIMQLVRSLEGMHSTVSEEDQLFHIFNGLPSSYGSIRLILETSSNKLTVAQVTLRLREYQEMQAMKTTRKDSSDEFEEDRSVSSSGYYQERSKGNAKPFHNNSFKDRNNGVRACYSCGSTTHIAFDCPKNANVVKCTNCRYIGGHKTEECRKGPRGQNNAGHRKNNNNGNNSKNYNNQKSSAKNNYNSGSANFNYASSSDSDCDSEFAHECYYKESCSSAGHELSKYNYTKKTAAVYLATNSSTNDVKLVLDSGSSVHTCNDRSLLKNVQPAEKQFVKDANGKVVEYNEAGTLFVTTEIEGKKKMIEINNVYYAPNCPVNLLSVGCLSKNGKLVMFDKDGATILTRKDQHVTMQFKKSNNIYVAFVQLAHEQRRKE